MKAILVIDVDNMNIDIDNTQATYIELQCNNITIQMALLNHWLKPMPQKKVFAEGLNKFQKGTKRGWNDCIDEILGDEE